MGKNYAYTILGIIIGIVATIFFYSPSISDLNKDITSKDNQIEELKVEIDEKNNKLYKLDDTKRELENKDELIELLQEQLLSYGIEPNEL